MRKTKKNSVKAISLAKKAAYISVAVVCAVNFCLVSSVFATVAPDTTAPVITITGANPTTLTVGDTWTDPGATATDNPEGDLTANIAVDDEVDSSMVGAYLVTYSVSDSSGNSASETRTVNVEAKAGNTPPVATPISVNLKENTGIKITLSGTDPDQKTTKKGVAVAPYDIVNYEIVDQPGHGKLEVLGFDISRDTTLVIYVPEHNYVGEDSFTFKAQDNSGADSAPATVNITVNSSGVCTKGDITGDDKIDIDDLNTLELMWIHKIPADLSADLDDNGTIEAPDFSTLENMIGSRTDSNVTGDEKGNCNPTAEITYSKDNGVTFSDTASVREGDVLTIKAEFKLIIGNAYTTTLSLDDGSGNVISLSDDGEMTHATNYGFIYNLAVPSGDYSSANVSIMLDNTSNEIGAAIENSKSFVIDNTAPVITLNSGSNSVVKGNTYTDPGATTESGLSITTDNQVDTSNIGTYTITYSATDEAGNIGTKIRTVTVGSGKGTSSSGGSSGSGTGTNYCTSVTYGDWSTCKDGKETRTIINSDCTATAEQLAGQSRSCTVTVPVSPAPLSQGTVSEGSQNNTTSTGGQVLGVKIWKIGSLIRTPDFRIFLVKTDMKLYHIKTLKELAKSYFGWVINNVPLETLAQYTIINK